MSEIFINRARAVAVTGHRVLELDFDKRKLEYLLEKCVEKGFDTFLIGMALGFDTICFQTLEKIKKKNGNIKIIACIPCRNQSYKFNKVQKEEYDRMIGVADEKIYVSEEYTPSCMQKRNKFMVDNASIVISYKRREFGGTAKTVAHAIKNQVPIIEI